MDDTRLRTYCCPLQSFAQAVLKTIDGHDSGYQFPLSPEQIDAGNNLLKCLHTNSQENILVFHKFAYPLLAANAVQDTSNKWNSPMECFLAIYNLKEDGNFQEASNVTQLFAKLEYHCRGATLFESHQKKSKFGHDITQYVLSPSKKPSINMQVDPLSIIVAKIFSLVFCRLSVQLGTINDLPLQLFSLPHDPQPQPSHPTAI